MSLLHCFHGDVSVQERFEPPSRCVQARKFAGIDRELLSVCRAADGESSAAGGSQRWHSRGAHCSSISVKSAALGAAYMAMETLGLAIPTPAGAENFSLPPSSGRGRSVVILGAGIAGLVSAYELQRAGYRVTILEARDRIGGRSWTIRGGDRIVQTGRPDQVASFDPGLYFNSGPARIPSTHRLILSYARRFGVQLEPFVNVNRNAGWDFGGKVQPERRMVEDMRGHLAELLAKAIDRKALDGVVPKDELDAVRQFLGSLCERRRERHLPPDRALRLFGRGRRLRPGAGAAAAARR